MQRGDIEWKLGNEDTGVGVISRKRKDEGRVEMRDEQINKEQVTKRGMYVK